MPRAALWEARQTAVCLRVSRFFVSVQDSLRQRGRNLDQFAAEAILRIPGQKAMPRLGKKFRLRAFSGFGPKAILPVECSDRHRQPGPAEGSVQAKKRRDIL